MVVHIYVILAESDFVADSRRPVVVANCQRLRVKGCVGEMQDSTSCTLSFAMKTERLVGIDELMHCIALYGQ